MRELPNTPASDHDIANDIARVDRRARLRQHAKRAAIVASIVSVVGAGASLYLAVAGIERCSGERCTKTLYYPFTAQPRVETTTQAGVLHGMRREWHLSGNVWIEGAYENGARIGTWREWFSDGTPRFEGTYRYDHLDGVETWYYPDGNREFQVEHERGARNGAERWWHENGALRRVGTYVDGKRDGLFHIYNTDGALAFSVEYRDGERVAGDEDALD